jgi:hypothetical protein
MKKLLHILKGFGLSFLFITLGIYILNTTDSIFGTIIGIANIVFWGVIIIVVFYKTITNSIKK